LSHSHCDYIKFTLWLCSIHAYTFQASHADCSLPIVNGNRESTNSPLVEDAIRMPIESGLFVAQITTYSVMMNSSAFTDYNECKVRH